jgi:hypothetical protein
VKFVNDGLVNVQVNVINIGLDGSINFEIADLPLPGESNGWVPPIFGSG